MATKSPKARTSVTRRTSAKPLKRSAAPRATPAKVKAKAKESVAAAPPPLDRAGAAVRDGIVLSLTTFRNTELEIVALVRSTVASVLGNAAHVADELRCVVSDVMNGAVRASEQVGTGFVASTRSIAKGIVLGVSDVRGDIVVAATETLKAVVKHASAAGVDVGASARQAADGIVEATLETGGNTAKVSRAAAKGAIVAAQNLGSRTARAVSDILTGAVTGIDMVVRKTPTRPGAASSAARAT